MYQAFYTTVPAPFLNDVPELQRVAQVCREGLALGALGHGPYDDAAIEFLLTDQFLNQCAQALAFWAQYLQAAPDDEKDRAAIEAAVADYQRKAAASPSGQLNGRQLEGQ